MRRLHEEKVTNGKTATLVTVSQYREYQVRDDSPLGVEERAANHYQKQQQQTDSAAPQDRSKIKKCKTLQFASDS